jgi:uncharacterized membrane protein YhhN
VAIIVAVYYFFIISILLPDVGRMKIPVLVYGLVMSFMLLIAMHLYKLKNHIAAKYILTGAIFFVLSDSVLAINKFYHPFVLGAWIIMIPYLAAQYMLTYGMVQYLSSTNK